MHFTATWHQLQSRGVELRDPAVTRHLFGDVGWAWIWLVLRVYLGWTWLRSGWGKVTSPAWAGNKAGSALTGFINGALNETSGQHPNVQGWYAAFLRSVVLPHVVIWSYLVTTGETLVGVALILGVVTGLAAFVGGFMNMSYLLAGSVSINPIMFAVATWLVMAWKVAGWWGVDRWLMPALARLWQRWSITLGIGRRIDRRHGGI
jgi:thiosulfate dehydrogenase [quinone] large subunit